MPAASFLTAPAHRSSSMSTPWLGVDHGSSGSSVLSSRSLQAQPEEGFAPRHPPRSWAQPSADVVLEKANPPLRETNLRYRCPGSRRPPFGQRQVDVCLYLITGIVCSDCPDRDVEHFVDHIPAARSWCSGVSCASQGCAQGKPVDSQQTGPPEATSASWSRCPRSCRASCW